ncbi:substrate-binding domain-containing protein [Phenylobacterium sp. LH3H17]|uniref:substrate-binding domain-containing protein n=1 Tax=Phenylobacterium sp. LH3H17 TaxID=2903901 RepID=UPI0020CA0E5C|nr:substrate-binding domain-containing protein [Phenylobacterium sp. LH3H17]UTP37773.1 substrate-binding domain-containing protein [Phenylobacterium sp. LH3H17]
MKPFAYIAAAALALSACGQKTESDAAKAGPSASGRDQVWAAGSSTVFPFATRVAENVARTGGGKAAKVESLGTGGGFKLFCSGTGAGYPDVANASRPIKKSEFEQCVASGVTDIVEIKIGFDGIVIANAKTGPTYNFKIDQIYRGLAAETPAGAGFAKNAAKTWKDVDAALPAQAILVYGPPPTSGTRDAFAELALEKGARKNPALEALRSSDEDAFKAKAHTIRGDGAWVDAGENDNAIVQTLTKTPNALGVFGYSFLENNMDTVKAATIDGVAPTFETISNGTYPVSRSLYIYVKKANIGVIPGLREYMNAFVSDAATGKGGYLQQRGLIPLGAEAHAAQKAAVAALTPMAAPTK